MNALLAIPEAELRPVLDARIFVEAREKGEASEIQRQSALKIAITKHAKKCMIWAIPNSAQTSRTKLRQHREGAVAGAADLTITWSGGVAFIEMKAGGTKPEPHQVDFLNRLARQGHHVAVCRTRDGALAWLRRIGAPVPEIRA